MKAFFSYSHHDSKYLEAVHKHLSQVKRDGLITTWYDREILAGSRFSDEIVKELDSSQLFIAIVSPDFISSNYCYDVEMTRALKKNDAGEMRIISIIVEPCEWKQTPLSNLKAVPRDGFPVSEWTNPNKAYLDIATELRVIAEAEKNQNEIGTLRPEMSQPDQVGSRATSSRYRVKRSFDQIDKSDFNRRSFDSVRDYFQRAIAEIDQIQTIKARFENYTDTSFGAKILNSQYEHGDSAITVHMSNGGSGLGDIYYSNSEHSDPGTANGWFSVQATDYEMLYDGSSMGRVFGDSFERGSADEVACFLWADFVRGAGIDHE